MDATVFIDLGENATEAERRGERDQPGHFEAGVYNVVLSDEECYHDIC